MTAPINLSSAVHHILTPIQFVSFSVQSGHLNFCLEAKPKRSPCNVVAVSSEYIPANIKFSIQLKYSASFLCGIPKHSSSHSTSPNVLSCLQTTCSRTDGRSLIFLSTLYLMYCLSLHSVLRFTPPFLQFCKAELMELWSRLPQAIDINLRKKYWGHNERWRSWSRHRATSRMVAGSVPDGVFGIFHWYNPSGRKMALGSTSPQIFHGAKGGLSLGLTTLPPSCAGYLEILEPQPPGSLRACPGLQLDCFAFAFLHF
jgi:hypothetical protein